MMKTTAGYLIGLGSTKLALRACDKDKTIRLFNVHITKRTSFVQFLLFSLLLKR